jgi:hypothetical protein
MPEAKSNQTVLMVAKVFVLVYSAGLLSAYLPLVAYTLGMKVILRTTARLVNEKVIELVYSHGHFSLAAQLRLCLTCKRSCPGIRNCPVDSLNMPSGVGQVRMVESLT